VLSNKNLGIAVTAIAVVFGLMLGVAGPGRAQDAKAPDKDKAPQTCPPTCNWKDNAEYMDAVAAQMEADPAKRLALLEKWKKDYPQTDPILLNIRQDMFLVAYVQTKQPRQAFDQALDILKDRPKDFPSLYATVSMVTQIKPAPTNSDMDTAEKNANLFIDNPDSVKPATMTDAQWATTKSQTKPLAESVLIAIYELRRDDKREVQDLTKLIQRDPTQAVASYKLGQTMIRIDAAEKTPEKQAPAFYHMARALAYEGPGAIPAAQKPAIQKYLTDAYKLFHGSTTGLDQVLALAKTNPFPPADFTIKNTVDLANEEEAARQAEIKKNPIMYLWVHGVKEPLAAGGDSYFDMNVKDAALPGPDPDDKSEKPEPRFFKAKIVSISPNPKPKEILVGIEKGDVADAKLTFEKPLDGKMDPGEEIEFWGAAKDWSHDPKNVVVTFAIEDPKTDLKGWTGKNAPATKGPARGTGASKGAAPKQAAPKQ